MPNNDFSCYNSQVYNQETVCEIIVESRFVLTKSKFLLHGFTMVMNNTRRR